MIRPRAGVIALATTATVAAVLLWPRKNMGEETPRLTLAPAELPADGYAIATLTIETRSAALPRVSFGNPHAATVERVTRTAAGWQAKLRAGIRPARTTVMVEVSEAAPAIAVLTTRLVAGDSAGDGTPDFLRLDDPRDRAAFRRWFTFLAEAQYFQQPASRPAEIVDCAALIRYAYREALRPHIGDWATEAHLPLVPPFESVARYRYPYTPLGSALFRVREGSFRPSDLDDGAFAQFADAQTLQRLNTHFVSRDLARALPGDLIFFRQDSQRQDNQRPDNQRRDNQRQDNQRQDSGGMPFHSMIYLGESAIANDGARYVVYHTGPDGADPGTIRRLSLPALQRFPEPQWRPIGPNRNFLGVYRWNILREEL
jgi:uncharacterized protein YfaT (DUF1175 family)